MEKPYSDSLLMTYSSYKVKVKTDHGIFLNKEPFSTFENTISSLNDYSITQELGSSMRKAKVETFQYISARDAHKGINFALFTAKSFQSKKPTGIERWICKITNDEISFVSNNSQIRLSFNKDLFLLNGQLPAPAC